jgi:endoglucanase
VVRAGGGNNDKRILLINPYAASGEASAINALIIPTDTMPYKLIVSLHSYAPYNFALNTGNGSTAVWDKNKTADTDPITQPIDRYYTKFAANGIPVIIGEFGAMNRNNEPVRAEWAKYYVNYAMSKGFPCFWWDNAVISDDGEKFGLLDRQDNTFSYPQIVSALTGAADTKN